MSDKPEDRLRELGITLPAPAAPVASYVPSVEAAGLLFISGQLPLDAAGKLTAGKLGRDLDIEAGKAAARLSAINILTQAKSALGGLDRIRRVARVTGFINGTGDFADPHQVLNGASDLLVDVLGDRGRHSRTVLVAASLPMNAATLIDAIIEVS
jgi:enamine deaminase RidA (YjgF/YER057c/UK114 family)